MKRIPFLSLLILLLVPLRVNPFTAAATPGETSAASAFAWPASREDLIAENITVAMDSSEYKSKDEAFLELFIQRNFGEQAKWLRSEGAISGLTLKANAWTAITRQFMDVLFALPGPDGRLTPAKEPVKDAPENMYVYQLDVQLFYWGNGNEYVLSGITCDPQGVSARVLYEYMVGDPRYADELTPPRNEFSEGLIEINLSALLGIDTAEAVEILDAHTLAVIDSRIERRQNGICVYLVGIPSGELLTSVTLDHAGPYVSSMVEEGVLTVWFQPPEPSGEIIQAVICKDGSAAQTVLTPRLMAHELEAPMEVSHTLPDSGIVIIERGFGLCARYPGNDEEALLLEGEPFLMSVYEYKKAGAALPAGVLHFWRAINCHRFIYTIDGPNSNYGFGIYNFNSGRDYRVTSVSESPKLVFGDTLFLTKSKVDLKNNKRSRISGYITGLHESEGDTWDYTPAAKNVMILTGRKGPFIKAQTYTLSRRKLNGELIKEYTIQTDLCDPNSLQLIDERYMLVRCKPWPNCDTVVYLIDVSR